MNLQFLSFFTLTVSGAIPTSLSSIKTIEESTLELTFIFAKRPPNTAPQEFKNKQSAANKQTATILQMLK